MRFLIEGVRSGDHGVIFGHDPAKTRVMAIRVGDGENDVKVLGVEQVRRAGVDPGRARQRLTRGAMAIPAAVVPDAPIPAAVALLDVAAQGGGRTRGDRGHHAPMRDRQGRTLVVTIGVAALAEDVRHRRRRAIHPRRVQRAGGGDGGATGRGRRSSGLAVAHTCVVAITRYRAVVARLRWPSNN